MHYKKIAIINDNPIILSRIIRVLKELGKPTNNFNFYCSPKTEQKKFQDVADDIKVLDMKKDYSKLFQEGYDLVFSIHCKQIFPETLTSAIKCINLHPGYNPINRGWYPQVFAIINGFEVGATIHEMDEFVDHGKIIDREKVQFNSSDTSLTVYERIVDAEIRLFKRNINNILNNSYAAFEPENDGNYFSKKEFNNLCEINLTEKADYRTVINRLRALTHGKYKNAWFIDEETGKKVYISINLEVEE